MGVLNVENRVFITLPTRQVEVEVEGCVVMAHEVEEPRNVSTRLGLFGRSAVGLHLRVVNGIELDIVQVGASAASLGEMGVSPTQYGAIFIYRHPSIGSACSAGSQAAGSVVLPQVSRLALPDVMKKGPFRA